MKLVIASVFLIAAASAAVVPVDPSHQPHVGQHVHNLPQAYQSGRPVEQSHPAPVSGHNQEHPRDFGHHLIPQNQQPQHPAHFGQHNKPVEPNSQPSSLVGQRSAGFGQHLDRPVTHKTGNEYKYDKHATNYHNAQESKILRYESEQDPEQGYKFGYHTSHGNEEVQRSEEAQIRRIDEEHASVAVQGVVEYVNHEGKGVRWTYTADENGYHPSEITVT
ncbi:uncharacterized protein LOC126879872 [Diabrotica virgifera virgifera]|uniref:Uncharacterized protein n=2 Tax=Diabrotica virgifera virgifera TaxID=50390 RepID=A0ABM5JMH7_DIAVI|nr:uncharacterized protein LOC126879872 [Diabrotica virgifera virgifera]